MFLKRRNNVKLLEILELYLYIISVYILKYINTKHITAELSGLDFLPVDIDITVGRVLTARFTSLDLLEIKCG